MYLFCDFLKRSEMKPTFFGNPLERDVPALAARRGV